MIVKIQPSKINGTLIAPASKSSMQRACAAALLHNGSTNIYNTGISNDDKAALNIITQLGAEILHQNNFTEIISQGFCENLQVNSKTINCGESGLSIRMFSPIAALLPIPIKIVGEGSLLKRPMNFFDEIFPKLGVEIKSTDGKLPIKIKGSLQPKNIEIDGSLSSQFLTGLLFAFGQAANTDIIITVNNLKSKPYIDLTLNVMKHFGFNIINDNYKKFIISPKSKQIESTIKYTVEGDWSSASFLLVAGAIAGRIKVFGLNEQSTQADKAIMLALKLCGAKINSTSNFIEITKDNLIAFEFDATECPDLFPPLVALAAYCKGTTIIKGTHRLAAKESDRAITLQNIFGKMGINVILKNDVMYIEGGKVMGAAVSSHHDHRIAMAAAVAALGANSEIVINDADAINKSYPQFFDDLKKLVFST
ncbi:MAG: 3-phosphoshikimate 1-carboxyvinyltransferase [Ferruginibacter sp.]|nr:3-phosphoshikimate 1-carboxyvinyltransferase [Ferruginibacter sp.]